VITWIILQSKIEGSNKKMENRLKILSVVLVCLLALSTVATVANAAPFPYDLTKVEVNGMEVTENGSPILVERGDMISVAIYLLGDETEGVSEDVRAKAWIGGYEYDEIEATTSIFKVLPGVLDKKVLTLEIPEDLDVDDTYELNVQIYGDNYVTPTQSFELAIEEVRHKLNIVDVLVSPSNGAQAGQPVFVDVRVENLGDNNEDNILVEARILELGVSDSEFLSHLITGRFQNSQRQWEYDLVSADTDDLVLMIPANAVAKDYELEVLVSYDRGHSVVKETRVLSVVSGNAVSNTENKIMISAAANALVSEAGKGAVYNVNIANLGDVTNTLVFSVEGISNWATYSVDPATLTLNADQSATVNLYVNANEDVNGVNAFTFVVKDANANVLSEQAFTLEVEETGATTAKEVLLYVFIVLLIVLVILGIVAVARKVGKKESEPIEGQTYY
jgi:hypothetical protein